ncbi:MAG: class I SAM-dependent methyltransferase [Bacteroidota bacterium]
MENIYQNRLVKFENILNLTDEMFDRMTAAAELSPKQVVLDAGAGYGAVTREIMKRYPDQGIEYHLVEISHTQLERARYELAQFLDPEEFHNATAFFNHDILETYLPSAHYDRVIAKMLWQEIPEGKQPRLAREFFRLVKPGGKLLLWQVMLDKEIDAFYRAIIREKDSLAGFDELVDNRHFPEKNNVVLELTAAGFHPVTLAGQLPYQFESIKRLHTDFKGDFDKLWDWNEFILDQYYALPDAVQERLGFQHEGQNIRMSFEWGLFVADRPL